MKFSGVVGFWQGHKEESPGVWKPLIIRRPYRGDLNKNTRRFQPTESQNSDLVINNEVSILADLYSKENYASIAYVEINGVKWKVTNVDISYPRLTLKLGGVYNGKKETTTS